MNKYIFWILFIYLHHVYAVGPPPHPPDLQGSYCASRPRNNCCPGRKDECSAPILGTLCYCDDFCNRTRNEDCCPDYWTVCRGYQLPPSNLSTRYCVHQGVEYPENTSLKLNCNQCVCQEVKDTTEVRLMCDNVPCMVDESLLDRVKRNYESLGWRAANYSEFWGRRYDEGLALRLGTIKSKKKEIMEMTPVSQIFDPKTIPRTFDSRIKWPGMISRPRDQGWCGASWIFSTVSVASDRFAIMTYQHDRTFLAPQHLLDCVRNQPACQGGYLTRAWTFIRQYGLVPDECYPWEGRQSECKLQRLKKRQAVTCSTNPQSTVDLHRVGPVYRIAGEKGIMNEILNSGPVQATMRVTRELFTYKSGIFKCTNLSNYYRSDHHSVRIVGWGEEFVNNQLEKYWIVSNSWGEWWGEDGFFRINRGTNECDIEKFVIAVWANVEQLNVLSNTIKQSQKSYKKNKT